MRLPWWPADLDTSMTSSVTSPYTAGTDAGNDQGGAMPSRPFRRRRARAILVLPFALTLLLVAALAGAETINCTPITSVPTVISVQGIYCLTGDLSTSITSGSAIEVTTNNVVIDLNGHKLGGLSAGPGTGALGVSAAACQNITIKNGTIRGYMDGINLNGGSAHVVEDIRADQNTRYGIAAVGNGLVVRNNQVVATGGSTLGPDASAAGIVSFGSGNRVLKNDIITVTKSGSGTAWGIVVALSTDALVVGNRITGADKGIDVNALSTCKYRDNLTSSVAIPYTGGTDAGNNN